jgi:hypothetical protein
MRGALAEPPTSFARARSRLVIPQANDVGQTFFPDAPAPMSYHKVNAKGKILVKIE